MRIESQKFSVYQFFVAAALALLAILVVAVMPRAQAAPASDERLITIHDRGEEAGLITTATNLRDVFSEADIKLDKNDLVEPGLDEKLVGNNYQVNVYRARPVVIVDGKTKQLVMTAYQTPRQIAEHAGIKLQDEDVATLQLTPDLVTDGASERMTVDRATSVRLTLYGESSKVYTQASTVKDFLADKNIELGPKDHMNVKQSSTLRENVKVEIWREGKQTITRKESIAAPVRQVQDADREIGYRKVTKAGVPGKKVVTYQITIKNGKEINRKAIQTVVVKKPVEQVEVVGAKSSFSGDFAAALAKLRACEAGGDYGNKNNPLYRGAYQFSYQTWANNFGIYDPADATPAQQDAAARGLYERRGWQPWPHCGASLPDTFR